jgi:hypothetical protein
MIKKQRFTLIVGQHFKESLICNNAIQMIIDDWYVKSDVLDSGRYATLVPRQEPPVEPDL